MVSGYLNINNLTKNNLFTFRIFFYKTNDNDLEILKKQFTNLMIFMKNNNIS
jgi:hypothetical protein